MPTASGGHQGHHRDAEDGLTLTVESLEDIRGSWRVNNTCAQFDRSKVLCEQHRVGKAPCAFSERRGCRRDFFLVDVDADVDVDAGVDVDADTVEGEARSHSSGSTTGSASSGATGRDWATRGPTHDGAARARRFEACAALHINAVRAHWPRPAGHESFGFWFAQECALRVFRVWKNGGTTLGASAYVPPTGLDVTRTPLPGRARGAAGPAA